MSLSPVQLMAIEVGEPVTVVIDHTECVVLRKDVFDKVQRLMDAEWSDDELLAVAARTVAEADAEGPIE
jgi:hypothetical protein